MALLSRGIAPSVTSGSFPFPWGILHRTVIMKNFLAIIREFPRSVRRADLPVRVETAR